MTRNNVFRFWGRGPRLKGLEEFQPPEFLGRMARVQRRRMLVWYGLLSAAVALGLTIGFWL